MLDFKQLPQHVHVRCRIAGYLQNTNYMPDTIIDIPVRHLTQLSSYWLLHAPTVYKRLPKWLLQALSEVTNARL